MDEEAEEEEEEEEVDVGAERIIDEIGEKSDDDEEGEEVESESLSELSLIGIPLMPLPTPAVLVASDTVVEAAGKTADNAIEGDVDANVDAEVVVVVVVMVVEAEVYVDKGAGLYTSAAANASLAADVSAMPVLKSSPLAMMCSVRRRHRSMHVLGL